MKFRWFVLTLILLPFSIGTDSQAQPAVIELILEQGVDDYTGTRDTSLFEEGELSNGGGQHLFAGLTNRNDLRRTLIAFDLSMIPEDATIVEASLQFTVSKVQFQRVNSNLIYIVLPQNGVKAKQTPKVKKVVAQTLSMAMQRGVLTFSTNLIGLRLVVILKKQPVRLRVL
jgi:hypothetical protein